MLNTIEDIRRYAKGGIKYRLNVADTKHHFCYIFEGVYYSFRMYQGNLVDANYIKCTFEKGVNITNKKPRYYEDYYNSTLNEYFNN